MIIIEFAFLKYIDIYMTDCASYNTSELLNVYHTINEEDKGPFRNCVAQLIQDNSLNGLLDTYYNNLNNHDSLDELNNNSMSIYINDYWYVIIKSIIYSLVLILFIYFYGITNLIENIKTSASTIKEQVVKVKDKIVDIKQVVKDDVSN